MNAEFDPAAEQEFIKSIRRYLIEAGPLQADGFDNEVKRVVGPLIILPKRDPGKESLWLRSRAH